TNFKEKFDKDYWEFMKYIWNFSKKSEVRIQALVDKFDKNDKVIFIKEQKDKEKVIQLLS
ncbi:MAG: hypothetical protein LBI13_06345, partial [Streptococcaceae bacterium]|nr:hypothetical protein [Streptococcaceae bacterium]